MAKLVKNVKLSEFMQLRLKHTQYDNLNILLLDPSKYSRKSTPFNWLGVTKLMNNVQICPLCFTKGSPQSFQMYNCN